MSSTTKRARAIVMAIIAVLSINYAISYASGIPTIPNAPSQGRRIVVFRQCPLALVRNVARLPLRVCL